MSERQPVADSSASPLRDLRAISWWKPRRVAVLGEPLPADRLLRSYLAGLLEAFRVQRHAVADSRAEEIHLMLAFGKIPRGGGRSAPCAGMGDALPLPGFSSPTITRHVRA